MVNISEPLRIIGPTWCHPLDAQIALHCLSQTNEEIPALCMTTLHLTVKVKVLSLKTIHEYEINATKLYRTWKIIIVQTKVSLYLN